MKKIKLLIMISMLFLFTGCGASYNVEIYNNTITETIDIFDESSSSGVKVQNKIFNFFQEKFGGIDELNRNFEPYDDNDFHSIRSVTTFDFDNYKEEIRSISTCCRSTELSNDGEYINFRALGYFKWFEQYEEFDELTIKVKTNHKVKEHNADEVARHTYTWHINQLNYKDKIPSLKLYSDRYVFNYNNEFIKKVLPIIIFIGIIVLGSGGFYFYLRAKSNSADQI